MNSFYAKISYEPQTPSQKPALLINLHHSSLDLRSGDITIIVVIEYLESIPGLIVAFVRAEEVRGNEILPAPI